MSHLSEIGLSVQVYEPLMVGTGHLYSYDQVIDSYEHSLAAFGGFDTANFSLAGRTDEVEDWLERGLGRHVRVVDSDLQVVWEGFVNEISVVQGSLSLTQGPLTALANRVSVTYNRLNTSYSPPTTEGSFETTIVNNLDSQAKYGIWEEVLSGGTMTAADADYVRDTFLAEHAWPDRSTSLASQGTGGSTVSLSCLGYSHWLGAYVYSQIISSGTVSVYTFLAAVLAATPNAVFSPRTDQLGANAMLYPAYENDNQFGDALVKKLLALGDVTGKRMLFGYYADRVPYYVTAPTTVEYQRSAQGNNQDVYRLGGDRLRPWRVQPGKWVLIADFLVGRPINLASLAQDLRCFFIESVQYTAPYTLSLSGGKLTTLDQILEQIASMGISA